jgi:hypothetical protein
MLRIFIQGFRSKGWQRADALSQTRNVRRETKAKQQVIADESEDPWLDVWQLKNERPRFSPFMF